KPVHLGGSLGRSKATGRGVFISGREVAQQIGLDLKAARVCVQGFGNVCSEAALLFQGNGSKVICVQDHSATLCHEQGIDIKKLLAYSSTHHKLQRFSASDEISASAFWTIPREGLIPAALEGAFNTQVAQNIQAKMILEGANGPT